MPKLSIISNPAHEALGDILIIPVDATLSQIESVFPKEVAHEVLLLMKKVQFAGQWGRAEIVMAPKGLSVPFLALVGMGNGGSSDDRRSEGIRRGVASAIVDGRAHLLRNVCIAIPRMEFLAAAVESALMTDYWFSHHSAQVKQEKKARSLVAVSLYVPGKEYVQVGRKIVSSIEARVAGITLTRDLVNQPASHMSPLVLAEEARRIAKASPQISVTVMNRKQALQKKFLAFLAVARGSIQEPYVIHLKYVPKKKPKKKIVIIGKGITFDSGGLSLKPANSMENMKIDMAGAATVLGLFSILPAIRPDVEVHGVILACENMPSGDAYRPGDIIESMSGKTIEVLNTDAEGRITLADALTYASGMKPDAIVDLATLTGACVVALGDTHAGLFGNSETLNQRIMRAAEESGEGMVEFPLPEEYRQTVQSRVADMRNTSFMRMGGAITAALFLQEFVGKSPVTKKAIDWAHIDIAGPVYAEMPLIPYWQFGATGYGVRMLAKLVEEFGE